MTPSISILTPLAPTPDIHPLTPSIGYPLKRPRVAHAPLDLPETGPESGCISTITDTNIRQWTGMPIRAIVPLPRRCRPDTNANGHGPLLSIENGTYPQVAKTGFGQPPANTHNTHYIWDEDEDDEDGDDDHESDNAVDSGEEMELDQGMNDKDMDDSAESDGNKDQSCSWCCSYESITATDGLSAWSFEELRVECYAQSLIARGTKPPPVVYPSLVIPPAFVPRTLLRIRPRSQ